ncbi:MAG: hypothetical protein ACRDP6_24570 [Actinoallomurus sp.]
MIFILALGASACIALPLGGLVALGWWVRSLRQGRRLDRSRTPAVCAIDSAGRPYEAVPVEPCGECGQTLPVDHECTGQAVTR